SAVLGPRFLPVVACAARPGGGGRDVGSAIVNYLPSPLVRPEPKGTHPKGPPVTRQRQAHAPALVLAVPNPLDHLVGRLTAFRVFSGSIKPGSQLLNPRTGHGETVAHIYRLDGNHQKEIDSAGAGDIVGLMKLKDAIHVGDTLCDKGAET